MAWNPQVAGCTGGARHGTHPQSARGSLHPFMPGLAGLSPRPRPPRGYRRTRDRGLLFPLPAWVRKRQACSAPDTGRRRARRSAHARRAAGTTRGRCGCRGGGARRRTGPRAHHVAPGSPGAVAGSPGWPPHSPRGWRKPFSPSAPPRPLTSDLRPHRLRVTPRSRPRGVFINRTPGGRETPDRWIHTQGNGAPAHAHPSLHPRMRMEARRGWLSPPSASLRSTGRLFREVGPGRLNIDHA